MNTLSSRRGFLGAALTGAAAAQANGQAPPQNPATPNIVYIHSHDSGRYLEPYGQAVKTPNLKKLAEQGVLFRQAFSGAPTCSPSRAILLTGQCAHQNGMLGLAHRGFQLNDYQHHLVHTLKKKGYHSVLAGLQHVAPKPAMIGYDEIISPKSNSAVAVAPVAVEFLKRKHTEPFFLDVGFFETHREYPEPSAKEDARYIQPPDPIPDFPQTRKDMAGFHASARVLDEGVGKVLAALEENGLAENTLVISTTDHGLAFPYMKCNLTDFGFGVSLILRGPAPFRGGAVCDALISHVDVFPTLCDFLGIEKPAWLEGKSFLPVLRGEQKEINEQVFAEVNYHASYEPKRAVRTRRWKYIKRYDGRTTEVLPNCDDGLSKSLWLEYGWKTRPLEQEDLYDLIFDPGEHRNLAKDPHYASAKKEMEGRLQAWMEATNDPLLHGSEVKAPHGARVNDPNGISPKETPITLP